MQRQLDAALTRIGFLAPKTYRERLTAIGFPLSVVPEDIKPLLSTPDVAKVEAYVRLQEGSFDLLQAIVASVQSQFNLKKDTPSNQARLRDIAYQGKIEPRFIDLIDQGIMTYPIQIDDSPWCVDYTSLLDWWQERPENKYKNYFHPQFYINKLTFKPDLAAEIEHFVQTQENARLGTPLTRDEIEVQWRMITKYINANPRPANKDRLQQLNYKGEIPAEFIAIYFNNEIVTQPIKLDGKYLVDFAYLTEFWENHPDLKYKNPYTKEPLRSISYDTALKLNLESFVSEPNKYLMEHSEHVITQIQLPSNALGNPGMKP